MKSNASVIGLDIAKNASSGSGSLNRNLPDLCEFLRFKLPMGMTANRSTPEPLFRAFILLTTGNFKTCRPILSLKPLPCDTFHSKRQRAHFQPLAWMQDPSALTPANHQHRILQNRLGMNRLYCNLDFTIFGAKQIRDK